MSRPRWVGSSSVRQDDDKDGQNNQQLHGGSVSLQQEQESDFTKCA